MNAPGAMMFSIALMRLSSVAHPSTRMGDRRVLQENSTYLSKPEDQLHKTYTNAQAIIWTLVL
eukprot:5007841-Pyramimonas_sp.AAC.1